MELSSQARNCLIEVLIQHLVRGYSLQSNMTVYGRLSDYQDIIDAGIMAVDDDKSTPNEHNDTIINLDIKVIGSPSSNDLNQEYWKSFNLTDKGFNLIKLIIANDKNNHFTEENLRNCNNRITSLKIMNHFIKIALKPIIFENL